MIYVQDTDMTLHQGDCLEVLRTLPDRSVHMCCTSPPFYGLRDYGTGTWEGGDQGCDHVKGKARQDNGERTWDGGAIQSGPLYFTDVCGRCGARRVDRQIGLEDTPDQWVTRLVDVFREVRRVLRDDGTLWIEIGDSYTGPPRLRYGDQGKGLHRGQSDAHDDLRHRSEIPTGMKPKDLLGQPWMLAFALRADGWWLRSEIIWAKPNPMPESVTDRPTKAHSTVFLLAKQPRYYFDADAIREDFASRPQQRLTRNVDMPLGAARVAAGVQQGNPQGGTHANRFKVQAETLVGDCGCFDAGCGRSFSETDCGCACHRNGERWPGLGRATVAARAAAYPGGPGADEGADIEVRHAGANARSVWTVPTEPTPFAHFATWPQKLCARMILAGTSERGCCPQCGAPWQRETADLIRGTTDTTGWVPSCECHGHYEDIPEIDVIAGTDYRVKSTLRVWVADGEVPPPVPSTVLDPFGGSGTTALVARSLGRRSTLIELSGDYCALAAQRLQQLSLLSEAAP